MVRDLRPAAVLGLGGFAAAPVVKAAERCGIRVGMLNPDAVPGTANRYLARRVGAIFTQFESTADAFAPRLRSKVRAVGCPIRRELLNGNRADAVSHFDLRPDRRTLLVFGGSLAASSINRAVAVIAGEIAAFADRWQILHVAGADKNVRDAYAGTDLHARVIQYCERMDLAYAAAELAICRGGASSVAELAATGTPAVILPYPHHRDRQQELNARRMVDSGAALLVRDAEPVPTAAALRQALTGLLDAPGCLEGMSTSARAMGRPEAASAVAAWLVDS
jgi:UDP-N-acetylglucosamine--N-acetylmuramyl-(pentapeptide) pyrophosphoryl-undecaprenol N-acetylglucosamine transferase